MKKEIMIDIKEEKKINEQRMKSVLQYHQKDENSLAETDQ